MFAEIIVVAPPLQEPVTVDELKSHARIVDPPDPAEIAKQDALLQSQITAARERCEGFTRRALIEQTIDVWYDSWDGPGVVEDLPRPPVIEVVSIICYDNGNQPTVANDAIYTLAGRSIIFMDWLPYFRPVKGIKIILKVGYGPDPEDVPTALRSGILEYATMLYEHRMGEPYEAEYAGAASAAEAAGVIPPTVYDLWRPYQIIMV